VTLGLQIRREKMAKDTAVAAANAAAMDGDSNELDKALNQLEALGRRDPDITAAHERLIDCMYDARVPHPLREPKPRFQFSPANSSAERYAPCLKSLLDPNQMESGRLSLRARSLVPRNLRW
jgi:hypothetical protein